MTLMCTDTISVYLSISIFIYIYAPWSGLRLVRC